MLDFIKLSGVGLAMLAGSASWAQTTIIGGTRGNGNFNGNGASAGSGITLTYAETPHWHHAAGDESWNFVFTSGMIGSDDSSSGGAYTFHNRLTVNDMGYTIAAAGETFSLSYQFGAGGGESNWESGNDFLRAYLFTTDAPVDASLTSGSMTQIGETDDYSINRALNGQWTYHTNSALYTSTAADIGKTVYLALVFVDDGSGTGNPRVENIMLTVEGGVANPPIEAGKTDWDVYVEQYGLSGYYLADADKDGVSDRMEFAHGGNPTNPADAGQLPELAVSHAAVDFFSLEVAGTNTGIHYTAEWTDNLITGKWQRIWAATNRESSDTPNYNQVVYQKNGGMEEGGFFRNRVFPPSSRPNILLILADDLGYADVGFNHPYSGPNQNNAYNGTAQVSTPELDRLADNGTIFTSAYVVHPFCGPSRMGLLSGRYPHDFGGPFNLPDDSSGNYTTQGISTNEVLLSSMLQDAGYYTGLMGKWHLGQEPEFHPNNRGFDAFYGFLGGGILYWGPYQASGWDYLRYPQYNGVADTSLGSEDHITDVLTDKGIDFIEQAVATADPFFLFMSYNAPHSIMVDGRNDRDQAKAEDLAVFADVPDRYRRNLLGLIRGMDRGVGQLVQALKDTGQYENTLIIFLSDNGGRSDEVGGWGDNGVLRGRKGDVTEGGFRVPMFMHWPNMIPSGVTYDYPVTALDFYPTFARLAGTEIPVGQEVAGKDLWDTLMAAEHSRPGEPIYTVTYSTTAASVGIRQDQWKALRIGNSSWALYDVASDISETVDVSGANSAVLSNLVSEGASWSSSHVQPLWWNNPSQETDWKNNSMPHYETVFVLP
ncbi:sulfatase family protein [Pontiella agarivorans]|uniref:Sulfatase-like hydrolase/transferase n=1 Tax=Pontiella agarivorans TaxID=3038953 RepID=A0ABU5MUB2_9BACT|nr:sulfatase-like hydrolase/transferase [Pontiella agarivorans]MDZ8117768.1 sulfatase-like hydrolase/transferase [Pontiella agarivorans]